MKYILVTGGVISGIGKGVIASSIGTLLKSYALRVTAIKIDPYINIDAGTFSPYEHGEVYVLDDGGEVDLDLGNYERFLDVTLHKDNNITSGKIYQHVIERERRGDYLGKTVQIVPHLTNAVQDWVERVAAVPVDNTNKEPEVCVIELGGTIGDIEGMPFVEAFRQFIRRVGGHNFCNVHVSLVPHPKTTGELKTKPTQVSVRELNRLGLIPDLIICRSERQINEEVREKISNFCNVLPEHVICIHDRSSIYRVPLALEEQGLAKYFAERLRIQLPTIHTRKLMSKWRDLADRHDNMTKEVNIALVGKYTRLQDSYASVVKALQHSALHIHHRLNLTYIDAESLEPESKVKSPIQYYEAWQELCKAEGVIVPGGFGPRGVDGMVLAIEWARVNKKPFLGVCLGMQCAVIEFARNVLNWTDANSTEVDDKTSRPVIIDMPEHHGGDMGGTMRVGLRTTNFKSGHPSTLKLLYGDVASVDERHRHRYEVNPDFVADFSAKGLHFVGQDIEGKRMEVMELEDQPYFVGVQYHPEYLSRPLKPSPPYLGLLLATSNKLTQYLARGCRLTPRNRSDNESSDDDDTDDFNVIYQSVNLVANGSAGADKPLVEEK
ncbi:CTP synthase 2-like [Oppia nitens]|uniref:CTP synthase 2-like n=1 Tax=Oppia nitens TaxID=1686743 RepID=UPI0023DCE63F|nr:CTP synthase 2-like [Oppia nitens]